MSWYLGHETLSSGEYGCSLSSHWWWEVHSGEDTEEKMHKNVDKVRAIARLLSPVAVELRNPQRCRGKNNVRNSLICAQYGMGLRHLVGTCVKPDRWRVQLWGTAEEYGQTRLCQRRVTGIVPARKPAEGAVV